MKKNKAAQEMAKRRHLSLTPERRKEIAKKAGLQSGVNRRQKKIVSKSVSGEGSENGAE